MTKQKIKLSPAQKKEAKLLAKYVRSLNLDEQAERVWFTAYIVALKEGASKQRARRFATHEAQSATESTPTK